MGFDSNAFLNQEFSTRTEAVEVPDLRTWFTDLGEGETPTWIVRGLTVIEYVRAQERSAQQSNLAKAVEAIVSDAGDSKVEGVKEALGISKKGTPPDVVKRLEMLVTGSVDPEITLDVAVKLGRTFPVEFMQITNKVLELTGKGQLVGKPLPFGEIQKSGT